MTTPNPPRLEGHPAPTTNLRAAGPAAPPAAVGEPKGAARKGVVSVLPRSKRFAADDVQPGADPTPDRPGIRIYAPPVYRHHYDGARWSKRHADTPTAAYACPCGRTGTARGQAAVAALATEYAAHFSGCTTTPATLERRNAA
ncbi:hypothetical protein N4P33_09925 [Streptomyces sp. 15-116A]|uniref:hypothetical protein n=1 Tax=Streptomyces sp. 15-116A TaxID=2259035 RepID=UPI0021B2AC21|nr:hypothetical protein [Streptomyces sp. 15-116A]MCT7352492.1 hypothetical protein [Streptomyces sp. 15-116A]